MLETQTEDIRMGGHDAYDALLLVMHKHRSSGDTTDAIATDCVFALLRFVAGSGLSDDAQLNLLVRLNQMIETDMDPRQG